jgi:hypothetical protein
MEMVFREGATDEEVESKVRKKGGRRSNLRPPWELFSSEVVMRLESKECRLQALTCERLAQRSTSPIVKGAYADLAKKWLKVADELQAVNAAKPSPYRQNEEAPYSARTGASKNAGSAA